MDTSKYFWVQDAGTGARAAGTIDCQHLGWWHLSKLQHEGNRECIYARLSNALEALREHGGLSEAAYAQARGDEPRPEHRHLVKERHAGIATPKQRSGLLEVETTPAKLTGAVRGSA